MSKYKGLFTFDEDNHRYVPIAQADGVIDTMPCDSGSKPTGCQRLKVEMTTPSMNSAEKKHESR